MTMDSISNTKTGFASYFAKLSPEDRKDVLDTLIIVDQVLTEQSRDGQSPNSDNGSVHSDANGHSNGNGTLVRVIQKNFGTEFFPAKDLAEILKKPSGRSVIQDLKVLVSEGSLRQKKPKKSGEPGMFALRS